MKKALIYLGATVTINIVINIVCRLSAGFSEWYATVIYPFVVVWARLTGLFPFAVVEILLYLFILTGIAGVVFLIIKLIKGKGKRKIYWVRAGLAVSCTASTLVMMYTFGCGINYHRRPFSYYSGLELQEYSSEDLRNVIVEVIGELELLVPQINICEDGGFVLDKDNFNAVSRAAMKNLAEIFPVLDAYYPAPKPVFMSRQLLSRMMIMGIFSPFTMEALYNRDMPDSQIPPTALHELSHLSGFMREDEAGFIAFLACRESGNAELMYAGYTDALWSLFAWYDGDDAYELYMSIPEQVRRQDEIERNYWWTIYDTPGGAVIAAVSGAVNDTYLKAQGQADGVKSYGRVVDLLIADYIERNNKA